MNTKTAWALVAIVALVLTSTTVALALHVDTRDIFTLVALVISPVVSFLIYGKVERLESTQQQVVQQTNGITKARDEMLSDMWQHNKDMQQQLLSSVKETAALPKADSVTPPETDTAGA